MEVASYLIIHFWVHVATRKLGISSEFHRNVVHHSAESLLLVSISFLLATPTSLQLLKENFYYNIVFSMTLYCITFMFCSISTLWGWSVLNAV